MEITSAENSKMLLSVQMIADAFNELGWDFRPCLTGDCARFAGWSFYAPGCELREDTLYLLPPELAGEFPRNGYSFVSGVDAEGAAPNLHGLNRPVVEIANALLAVFRRYREFEVSLNHVVNSGGTLTDLCRAAEDFFNNPIFIHDNMFVLIGLPRDIATSDQFSHSTETRLVHLPMRRIDEFRFDPDFIRTYEERRAAIWDNKSGFRSLFVNLFDGDQLYGRLLINERQSALCSGQLKAAEYLAHYAMLIIRRDAQRAARSSYSFQDTFTCLALGQPVPEEDTSTALNILGWRRGDRFLCARLCSQGSAPPISPVIVVQSALSAELKNSFSFLYQGELCVLVNLSRSEQTLTKINQVLAAQVRDNFLFGGISNPFDGLAMLPAAFRQAGAAMDYASRSANGVWLVAFGKCALEYIEDEASKSLPTELLVAPALMKLRRYDAEKSADYYNTLRSYLAHACDIPATAKALIIHRTTLTYRLERIRELIPLDPDDPTQRLYLQLSFHMLDRRDSMQDAT